MTIAVTVRDVAGTYGYPEYVDDIGTTRQADVTGHGQAATFVEFLQGVEAFQQAILKQDIGDEVRVSFQPPEDKRAVEQCQAVAAWW